MTKYKARFEAPIDLETFLEYTGDTVEVFSREELGIEVGTELIFKTTLPKVGIQAILSVIPDSHIAFRTLELV